MFDLKLTDGEPGFPQALRLGSALTNCIQLRAGSRPAAEQVKVCTEPADCNCRQWYQDRPPQDSESVSPSHEIYPILVKGPPKSIEGEPRCFLDIGMYRELKMSLFLSNVLTRTFDCQFPSFRKRHTFREPTALLCVLVLLCRPG